MDVTKEILYEQANENWRFPAKWRQMALAGHLAVLAGALSFVKLWVERQVSPPPIWLFALFVIYISFILWLVDRRTHRLTMDACCAGVELEATNAGFFRVNATHDKKEGVGHKGSFAFWKDSHSRAALFLFVGTATFSLLAVLFLLYGANPVTSEAPTAAVWRYRIIYSADSRTPDIGLTILRIFLAFLRI